MLSVSEQKSLEVGLKDVLKEHRRAEDFGFHLDFAVRLDESDQECRRSGDWHG